MAPSSSVRTDRVSAVLSTSTATMPIWTMAVEFSIFVIRARASTEDRGGQRQAERSTTVSFVLRIRYLTKVPSTVPALTRRRPVHTPWTSISLVMTKAAGKRMLNVFCASHLHVNIESLLFKHVFRLFKILLSRRHSRFNLNRTLFLLRSITHLEASFYIGSASASIRSQTCQFCFFL